MTDKTLREFMGSEGWVQWETSSRGRNFYVWRKHGFEIKEEDIVDNWEERRELEEESK